MKTQTGSSTFTDINDPNRLTNEETDRQTDGQTNRQTDRLTEWLDIQTHILRVVLMIE